MDGFEPGARVVVMAATNRAEILDAALLRPGRFDRTVEIPLPNQVERTAILAIHGRGKTLAPDVDLDVVSRGTPGFSGADLANLVNEAAINAVRADRRVLTAADFDDRQGPAADRPPGRVERAAARGEALPSPSTRPGTRSWPRSRSTPIPSRRSRSFPAAPLSA